MGQLRTSVTVPDSATTAYTVVALVGEVDATNSDELHDLLDSVGRERPALVLIDLSGLSFMDSTGLRMLLRSSRVLDQQGGVLGLVSPQAAVVRVLQLTKADQLIPVYDSVDAALADR